MSTFGASRVYGAATLSLASDPSLQLCCEEQQSLSHVKEALRVAVKWKVAAVGATRKLSTLRFLLRSFERHLDRLMALEETGGYLGDICDAKPRLWQQAFELMRQHDEFRRHAAAIGADLDQLVPLDLKQLSQKCGEIVELLYRVDQHDASEISMIQVALLLDEGGEG